MVLSTYHHPTGQGDAPAAIRIRYDIPVADAEERDSRQPQGIKQVCVLIVVKPWLKVVIFHNLACISGLVTPIVLKLAERIFWVK